MPTTADVPKCFAEVRGKRLLDWGLQALRANGIEQMCFIGGYQIDRVRAEYPEFIFRHNSNWENNNILASLMYAEDLMDEPFICLYADILYTAEVVQRLLSSKEDIALSVDTCWLARYEHRTLHPPDDAEKVTAHNGSITRIDRAIKPADAYGEYTGIARFSARGGQLLKEHFHRCRAAHAGKPFREAALFEKAYLIHLFQEMIEAGVTMAHADTPGDYLEVDTQQDFELAQKFWRA
jgi:L-glutamine-phosphate cytidylyltransferase